MIVPLVLFLIAFAAAILSFLRPELGDLILVAGPAALASLYLLVRVILRRGHPANVVVLDGSNVMHWKDGEARLETVREVIERLSALGFTPGVVFDANAGYKLEGRYSGDRALAQMLYLHRNRVIVVDKGVPADPVLLDAARNLGARVVSNDRFRDWVDEHPELKQPGHVIRGGYRDGKLWLDLDGA
ncbi:NYN domain-containing protein [Aliiruegeria lutimaris]|uniref:Zc3h12a-like Ribonuclease NYN domain-containing protein n=1 Tax=Aliiruegeria lutimaris TaxID=571298 RepID=A0A1G9GA73_9RHOB|nr:hypothetical protein [Aliiruegeria lutimaris]SDK97465.1 Zc3h12a-like Ribonuclease NYN domain-containing protein [Aliiruegeria lutimaris]